MLIIWAPTARCGVTLLQRLITSTNAIFVYGENAFLMRFLPDKIMEARANRDQSRARFINDQNFWSSSVNPEPDKMIDFYSATICNLFDKYQGDCPSPEFGIKEPLFHKGRYEVINNILHPRHIYISRGITDIIRSYKARKWIVNIEQVRQVCALWMQANKDIADLPIYKTTYERLVSDPHEVCYEIGKELDIEFNADKVDSIMQCKVNTFLGSPHEGHSFKEYINPVELTKEELEAILNGTTVVVNE